MQLLHLKQMYRFELKHFINEICFFYYKVSQKISHPYAPHNLLCYKERKALQLMLLF